MARFSIEVPSYVPVDSVDHVLLNANWIKKALESAGYSSDNYHFETRFNVGDLHCECETEEELRTEALGHDIEFYSTSMVFLYDDKRISFFFSPSNSINEGKNVSITSNDKTMLSCVVGNLMTQSIEECDTPGDSIVIHADGATSSNFIVGSGNITSNHSTVSSSKKSFWKDIWAGIVKNIVWVVLVAIILILLTVLGITQPNWLKL